MIFVFVFPLVLFDFFFRVLGTNHVKEIETIEKIEVVLVHLVNETVNGRIEIIGSEVIVITVKEKDFVNEIHLEIEIMIDPETVVVVIEKKAVIKKEIEATMIETEIGTEKETKDHQVVVIKEIT